MALGERDGRIWEKKRDFLARHHGMVLMLTHPDYLTGQAHLDAYRRFLITTRQFDGCWHALPREVAAWWKKRDQSTLAKDPGGEWIIQGPAHDRGSVASAEPCDGRLSIQQAAPAPKRDSSP